MIPYGRQTIDKQDIKAVVEVLKSDYLTTGPKVAEFEKKFRRYVDAKYAVAVSSATAGLHLACLAVGLSKGDEVITSSLTFCASSNCALYCQAKPIFVDINEQGLIDENLIEKKINKRTKIIIPVHYGGLPCNLKKLKQIAKKYRLVIIEDAAHALGAKYKKTKIGDCRYSDMAVFSFHPVKHITTGEGGIITTNNKKFYEKLLMLRSHGITKDQKRFSNQQSATCLAGRQVSNQQFPYWWYEMQELGFNYRLTDIQCALGISQLKKNNQFIAKRRKIAETYNQVFKDNKEIEIIKAGKDQFNAYHLYPIRVKNEKIRFKLFNFLKKNGILCQVHYIPVYWHPYYQKLGYKRGLCPIAEEFFRSELSLPLFSLLKKEEIGKIVNLILRFFKEVSEKKNSSGNDINV